MTLFDIPERANRSDDIELIKKTKAKRKASSGVRKGNSIEARMAEIKILVDTALGEYKDKYMIIQEEDVLHDYLKECKANSYLSIDTETTGLDVYNDIIAGICINTYGQKPAYIPLNHISYITGMKIDGQLPIDLTVNLFEELLSHKPDIDMFHANFDVRVLRQIGMKHIYCTWDAYLATRILNENEPANKLKPLHNKYCLDGKGDAFTFDKLFKGIPFIKVPIGVGYVYAAHDADITTEYADYQRKYLRPDSEREDIRNMYWVFKNIEMPCVSVVADIEDTGVELDLDYAQVLSEKYHKILDDKVAKFNECCAECQDKIDTYREKNPDIKLDDPINIGSPTQLAILLYDILKIKHPDGPKARGTGEEVLIKIDNDITKAILEWREVSKLLSTYIDKLPNCVGDDRRIHCNFNQYGADTGRFSSSDPNLQNIPSHNKDVRKMFVASPGYVLMSSDYSQQEPKVMTQMCQDPKMIKAYQEGKDLYAEIAALSFNTTYDNCLEFRPDGTTNPEGKNRRSQAKSILLGVLYGRGVPSIAEQLGTTTKKAQAIKDSVFKGFPAIPKFERDSLDMAYEKGYVTTLWGRKRRLPDLQLSEYEFSWIAGTAPDDDPLNFDGELPFDEISGLPIPLEYEVPEELENKYIRRLHQARYYKDKIKIFEDAEAEGIKIIDNSKKIAESERQCVNARIQGSAADMTKLAMILIGNDERMKELGFRMLIQVHDELIAECPEENMKECAERFAMLMSKAAESKLTIPIKCDVEITRAWYGEKVDGSEIQKKESQSIKKAFDEISGKHGSGNWHSNAERKRQSAKRKR